MFRFLAHRRPEANATKRRPRPLRVESLDDRLLLAADLFAEGIPSFDYGPVDGPVDGHFAHAAEGHWRRDPFDGDWFGPRPNDAWPSEATAPMRFSEQDTQPVETLLTIIVVRTADRSPYGEPFGAVESFSVFDSPGPTFSPSGGGDLHPGAPSDRPAPMFEMDITRTQVATTASEITALTPTFSTCLTTSIDGVASTSADTAVSLTSGVRLLNHTDLDSDLDGSDELTDTLIDRETRGAAQADDDLVSPFNGLQSELEALDSVLASLVEFVPRERADEARDANLNEVGADTKPWAPESTTQHSPDAAADTLDEAPEAGGMVLLLATGDPNELAINLAGATSAPHAKSVAAVDTVEVIVGAYQSMDVAAPSQSPAPIGAQQVNAVAPQAERETDASVSET